MRARVSSGLVVVLAVLGYGVAVPAALSISEPKVSGDRGNFDRSGVVVKSGRAVRIAGPTICPAGDTVRLRATISQIATGAVAEGSWSATCTGHTQHWHTTALVADGVVLVAGAAEATGLAIVRHAGRPVEAGQWLSVLNLR